MRNGKRFCLVLAVVVLVAVTVMVLWVEVERVKQRQERALAAWLERHGRHVQRELALAQAVEVRLLALEAELMRVDEDVEVAHMRIENLLFALRALAGTQGCRYRLPVMPYRVERPLVCDGWDHRWSVPVGSGQCYGERP